MWKAAENDLSAIGRYVEQKCFVTCCYYLTAENPAHVKLFIQ